MIQDIINSVQQVLQNNVFQDWGLGGLFINSLLSATALPIPAELLASALLLGGEPKLNVFLVLLLGSVSGGFINYGLGFSGNKIFRIFSLKKDKDIKPNEEHKLLKKYGPLIILFTPFIPIIGDIILISAGAKKYDFKLFALLMIVGKVIKITITVYLIALIPNISAGVIHGI